MNLKFCDSILSITLARMHILTSSLFCWFCFDNTQLLAPIFWNLEELYFSLPEGEVRFLKSACTNSHQPKKYFMSLFVMWDGKEWISHAQPMTILKSPTLNWHWILKCHDLEIGCWSLRQLTIHRQLRHLPLFATESVMYSVAYGCLCMKLHVAWSKAVNSG